MGGKSSCEEKKKTPAEDRHSELPVDDTPYPGPKYECKIAVVFANATYNRIDKFLKPGSAINTCDVSKYYSGVQQLYSEYYRLAAFFRIPDAAMSADRGESLTFQGW